MVNEFASLEYNCSPNDLAPSGIGYNSITNQVCAVVGSSSGQGIISGSSTWRLNTGLGYPICGETLVST